MGDWTNAGPCPPHASSHNQSCSLSCLLPLRSPLPVIGSITLSVIKRLHTPVMVVTANSRANLNIGSDLPGQGEHATQNGSTGGGSASGGGGGRNGTSRGGAQGSVGGGGGSSSQGGGGAGLRGSHGLRFLALVENQSYARNMLSYMCTSLMDGKRGDRLLLAQVQVRRAAGGGLVLLGTTLPYCV